MICEECEKEIKSGDVYIKNNGQRYCDDCFTASTVSEYHVDASYVGTSRDTYYYDEFDKEVN